MAQKSISLFCLKITNKTDKMFQIFKNAYNEIIPNYMNFQVIEYKYNALADTIMNYAREIFT